MYEPSRKLWAISLLMGFLVFAVGPALMAQVVGSTLSGTVLDPSGAVIASASVSATHLETGIARTTAAKSDGAYAIPNLKPGQYKVEVVAKGFQTAILPNILLTVGAEQQLNITLHVGQTSESIQVTEVESGVQLASSELSAVVDSRTVRELPLNGRDWTQLATLQPGVTSVREQQDFTNGAQRGNRGFGAQLIISGGRPTENNYRIDGISMNDYSNAGPGSVVGGNLGVDAIQEFSVLTGNYSAEYGRTAGGVINGTTRSGTNHFHGSVYEFLRNSALDAKNYFDTSSAPPFKRNQFGGSFGGPILKDRTFFFADYEGLRQSLGATHVNTVPSLSARQGQLCSPPNCATTTMVAVNPAITKFLGFYPAPNGGTICPFDSCVAGAGDTGIYKFVGNQIVNENFFITRLDHHLSAKDSIFGSYMLDNTSFSQPTDLNAVLTGSSTKRQLFALEETHLFTPAFVNSVRFGISREVATVDQSVSAINPLASDASLGAVPGRDAPAVRVPGLTLFEGGIAGPNEYDYHWTSIQAYDDAFLTLGPHTVKFGFAIERLRDNVLALSDPTGAFRFGSLSNFLTNTPAGFNATVPGTLTPRALRQTIVGGYLQDDWRVLPHFTLNVGIRYEMASVPTEVKGELSTLRSLTDAQPHIGSPYFSNPTLKNIEPRLGFSWDPFKDGKTAIRGGYGIFDVLPLPYEFNIIGPLAAPFLLSGSTSNLPQGSFPGGAFGLIGVDPTTLRQAYVEPHPKRDYVQQYNFNIQREFGRNLTGMVAYAGSHGVHQVFRADDVNMVLPTLTSMGYVWPTPAGSGQLLNPSVGQISALQWTDSTLYNSLQAQLTKRMSRGLQFQASYTWGKSIDDGSSGGTAGDPFTNSISSLFFFDSRLRRGLSDYNIAHKVILSYIWDLPRFNVSSSLLSGAVNGWELGGVYERSTGTPFTPLLGGDPLGLNSNDPFAYPDRITGPGCGSAVNPGNPNYIKLQCFAFPNPATRLGTASRNSLIGPGLSNLDFALYKNIAVRRISENFNVQFRAEAFNVLNHTNFASPINNSTLFDQSGSPVAGAGLVDATSTTSRQLQLSIKLIW
jgi:hypothetical protein